MINSIPIINDSFYVGCAAGKYQGIDGLCYECPPGQFNGGFAAGCVDCDPNLNKAPSLNGTRCGTLLFISLNPVKRGGSTRISE